MLDDKYYKQIDEETLEKAQKYFHSRSNDILFDRVTVIPDDIKNIFFNENISIDSNSSFEKGLYNAFLKSPEYDLKIYESGRNFINDSLSNFAQSVEAKNMILDYIYQGKSFSSEEFLKANAKAFEGETVSHGLYAFNTKDFTIKEFNVGSEKDSIKKRLENIKNNKNIELATTSENYAIGDVGIFGKAKNAKYAYKNDLWSIVENNSRKHGQSPNSIISDLTDILESYESYYDDDKFKKFKLSDKHDEIITEIGEIESLWAKENYFEENKDFIISLMKENDIQNLEILPSNNNDFIERINRSESKKFTYKELTSNNILSPKEAFEKYGPDSNEFYTSQGLDPKEQRKITNELNSKRKPKLSDKETLNKLHNDTKEAANQFYKTTEEANQIIEEYNQLKIEENKPKPEKPIQKPSKPKQEVKKPIQEVKKPESKIPENIDFSNILEDTAKETAKQNNKLTNKTIQNTAKKALNTKALKIAAIGTIALAGITGLIAHDNNKKKKHLEEKEEYNYQNNINYNNSNNNYIDYNNDLIYANNITNFSKGHSTYSLK